MNGKELIAKLRELCSDLDAGRALEPIRWRRAVGPLALPAALIIATSCGPAQVPSPTVEDHDAASASSVEAPEQDAGPTSADSGDSAEGEPDASSAAPEAPAVPAVVDPAEAQGEHPRLPRVVASEPTVVYGGPFPREVIQRVVRQRHPEVTRCYEVRLGERPNLAGRVTLRWTIDETGRTREVEVVSSTLNDAAAEQCLVAIIRGLEFPGPRSGGVVQVTYPFNFGGQ